MGPLIEVPGKKGFTAEVFQRKVAGPMLAWASGVFGQRTFSFVLDNAKQHTAKSTNRWYEAHDFPLHPHPAESPDLNRIEKVWAVFKQAVDGKKPQTEAAFKKLLQMHWQRVSLGTVCRLIDALPNVMAAVHDRPEVKSNL